MRFWLKGNNIYSGNIRTYSTLLIWLYGTVYAVVILLDFYWLGGLHYSHVSLVLHVCKIFVLVSGKKIDPQKFFIDISHDFPCII